MAGAVALAVVGAVVGAVGAIRSGNAAKKQADFQAKVAQNQATRERQVAASQAEDSRRASSRRRAAGVAEGGASGVRSGTGSSLFVAEDFAGEEELQALRILEGGEVGASRLESEATLLKAKGKSAQTAGFFRAGSTLLKGAGTAFGSFKSSGRLTSAETAPQFGRGTGPA